MAYTVKINVPNYNEHKAETALPDFKIVITNLFNKKEDHYRVEKFFKVNGKFDLVAYGFNTYEFTGEHAAQAAQVCAFKFAIEVI